MASKLRLVKTTMTTETATIPLPVAQMTPPSKVPHSPMCSSPESIDTGFYDVEVISPDLPVDEYQLLPQQIYNMPQQYEVKFEVSGSNPAFSEEFTTADLDKLSELVGFDETTLLQLQPTQPTQATDLDIVDLPSSVNNWEVSGSNPAVGNCYFDLSSSHYGQHGQLVPQHATTTTTELPLLEFEMSDVVESSLKFVH